MANDETSEWQNILLKKLYILKFDFKTINDFLLFVKFEHQNKFAGFHHAK